MQQRTAKPYERAKQFTLLPPGRRRQARSQQRSDYLRIAALGETIGGRLDELGASHDQVRWVAGPGPTRPDAVGLRFRALEELLQRRGTWGDFCRLRATMPPCRPGPGLAKTHGDLGAGAKGDEHAAAA